MTRNSIGAGLAALLVFAPIAAQADREAGLAELVQILHQEGVLDQEQAEALTAKAAAREAKGHWTDRIRLWGDLRARYEAFAFSRDETGEEALDRHRARYRARLNVRGEVNDRVAAFLRLASGDDDPRSTNQSFGSGVDFDTDGLRLDRAYIELSPWAGGEIPGHDGRLSFEVGKVPNPFVWKMGRDVLLWDHDINPEGVQGRISLDPTEEVEIFARTAYYVIDENGSSGDPDLFAGQIGSHVELSDRVRAGGRFSVFAFRDLDDDFLLRSADSGASPNSTTSGAGSLVMGLSGGHSQATVLSGTAYLQLSFLEAWPILVFGTAASNLDAHAVPGSGAGQEDLAWSLGLEVGDKQEFVKLGFLYAHLEANAFPSQFVDSDLFDGRTNRKGFAAYLSRRIWKNTDFNFVAFVSDEIEAGVPPFGPSVENADRVRIQADLQVGF